MTTFVGGQLLPSGFNCMVVKETWVSVWLNQSFSRRQVSFTRPAGAV